ncbi:MAG: sugar phosphate nucleotidyltransferase [Acidobacteria bacterium]|nr:sugar phosphate nucleotidyltransferase [Acidobacteriota bacterium]
MKNREKTKCAVILAAGLGERFLPITKKIPKPAIPFLNKPMICWTLEQLIDYGVEKAFINLHHLSDAVKDVLNPYKKKIEISFSYEKEILGTYGLFSKFRDSLPEKTFVINSDVFMKIPLLEMDKIFAENNNFNALLLLRKKRKKDNYTSFAIEGRYIKEIEKGDFHFCGAYIARKDFLRYASEEKKMELMPALKKELKNNSLGCYVFKGQWLDLGTPEKYLMSTKTCLKRIVQGKMDIPKGNNFYYINRFPVLAYKNSIIFGEIDLRGFAVLGKKSRITALGKAKNFVVLDNCSIETSKAENAIFYDGGCLFSKMDKNQNTI